MVKRPRNPPSKPLLHQDDTSVRGGRRRARNPEQPHLPFDPMPARIEPCLDELMPRAPTGDRWSYEIKWDGYRIAVHKSGDQVKVITRGGHDWSKRFPAIVSAAKRCQEAHASSTVKRWFSMRWGGRITMLS